MQRTGATVIARTFHFINYFQRPIESASGKLQDVDKLVFISSHNSDMRSLSIFIYYRSSSESRKTTKMKRNPILRYVPIFLVVLYAAVPTVAFESQNLPQEDEDKVYGSPLSLGNLATTLSPPAADKRPFAEEDPNQEEILSQDKPTSYDDRTRKLKVLAQGPPTRAPTRAPTKAPTRAPTKAPTRAPTKDTTRAPTKAPTRAPTKAPTRAPTRAPTGAPSTRVPTRAPTRSPTRPPTPSPVAPTRSPTRVPTLSPAGSTQAPVLQDPLFTRLESFIAPTPADRAKFSQVTSPQAQAFAWLKDDSYSKKAGLLISTIVECYALAVFYFSTNGKDRTPDSPFKFSFLTNASVCTWTGVGCGPRVEYVQGLQMGGVNLNGTLPWEISLLSNLTQLRVHVNNLSGPIPSQLSNMPKLVDFEAGDNRLTGTLPKTLPSSVTWVELQNNLLTGSIPFTLPTSIPKLKYFDVSRNRLTGTVPSSFGQLVDLNSLSLTLTETNLTGSVDSFLCQNANGPDISADCEEVTCACCDWCCTDGGGCRFG